MKILYFAWLRERLNKSDETVFPPADVTTINQLMDWMSAQDEGFELAFANRKLIRTALNEKIVGHDTSLEGAQTIAFFPPMTGG